MSQETYLWYQAQRSKGSAFLNRSQQYEPLIRRMLSQNYFGTALETNISAERKLIDRNDLNHKGIERGHYWYALMTDYQNLLRDIEKKLSSRIKSNLDKLLKN